MAPKRHKKTRKNACELDDTFDDGTPSAISTDDDKENALRNKHNPIKKTRDSGCEDKKPAKTKRRATKKSAGRRQETRSGLCERKASQESPPPFAFKRGKSRFQERKQQQQEQQRQNDEAEKKRIRDLVAYFNELDKHELEVV